MESKGEHKNGEQAEKKPAEQLDLATISWRFEAWLNVFPLHRRSLLDYFKHSPFYDRSCNNEVILQQNADQSQLRNLTGIEYEVDGGEGGKDESYFLIRKHYRDGPSAVRTLTLYFVVGADLPGGSARGTVFPLPDMHSVFAYNLATSLYFVNSAFKELTEAVKHNPGKPHTFEFKAPAKGSSEAAAAAAAAASAPAAAAPAASQRHALSSLVDDVLAQTLQGL